jgi:hypothetical protein
MSVGYDILLDMDKNWWKYDYVCSICDALIEITNKSNIYKPHICCGIEATWLSVVNATIYPTIIQKEAQNMETTTETLPQVMKLDWVENDVTTTKEYTEADVRHMVWQNKNLTQKQNEWYRKESQLRTLLEEVIADSQDAEVLEQIADIFDVPLTKEIEATVWVRVSLTAEVDIREGDYDIEDMVRNNLTVDCFGSEISVNDFDVERVEEGLY